MTGTFDSTASGQAAASRCEQSGCSRPWITDLDHYIAAHTELLDYTVFQASALCFARGLLLSPTQCQSLPCSWLQSCMQGQVQLLVLLGEPFVLGSQQEDTSSCSPSALVSLGVSCSLVPTHLKW